MTRRSGVAALIVLLAGSSAAAASRSEWLGRFEAPAECPAASVFSAAVEQRLGRPLGAVLAGLRLDIVIERDRADAGGSLIGQLRVVDASGAESTRSLRAQSCAELVAALSLVAVLGADASQRRQAAPLSAPTPNEPATSVEPDDVPRAPPSATPDVFALGPAAYVLVQNVATPAPELGVGLALSLNWPRRGYWAPALQLGAYRLQSGEEQVGSAAIRAHFELTAAHAVGCPLRVPAHGAWALEPCLEFDLGQLRGSGGGSAISQPNDRRGLWASSGLSLRAEVSAWTPLRLSASLGAVLPWTRHEFYFDPDVVAFRVPDLGMRGTFSAALLF